MLLLAVALPVCLVVFMGPVQAQHRRPITPPKTFNPPTIKPPNFDPPRNFNPPGMNQPNNPFNQPGFNPPNLQTWVCSRCGANLGNGAAPVGQCPSCKARIINGAGGGGNPGFNPPNIPNPNPPPADFVRFNQTPPAAVTNSSSSGTVGYIMGAIAGLGMMIGGVITSLKCGGIF
jgi:hypothetical protein